MDISAYVDGLVARGHYHFTTHEVAKALELTPVAARAAVRRLRQKGRVAMPYRGFIVAVPPEFRSLGCLPAEQFVPHLMEHLGLVYYVGLLSAAALHGAAHQAPMVFQVVVATNRPAIRCGKIRVQFIARRNVADIPTEQRNTPRGTLRLSTVEATAFDLVGYPHAAGGLSNAATVLSELQEKLGARKLVEESERSPLPWAQRLGYLLDRIGAEHLAEALLADVAPRNKEYVPLRARKAARRGPRDARWRVIVNERVEVDV